MTVQSTTAAVDRPSARAQLMRLVDRASIYLPVVLMAILAMGTWWLARITPELSSAPAARTPTHEPDYFMRGFSVRDFDRGGRMRNDITGLEMRHYPDTDTLEIDRPRLRTWSEQGVLSVATADKALAQNDRSQVQLLGNAYVVRQAMQEQAPLEFRGEFIQLLMHEDRVRSHLPVRLTRGADQLSADAMEYDHATRVLQLTGRVRVQWEATPAPSVAQRTANVSRTNKTAQLPRKAMAQRKSTPTAKSAPKPTHKVAP